MLTLNVFNRQGDPAGTVEVDPADFGGEINKQLLHDVVVQYLANQRAGTHSTKRRGEVAGSTKKLFRQKGTGNARVGPRRTNKRRGGGTAKGPKPRDYEYHLPKKVVRAATRMAVLSKFVDSEVVILDDLAVTEVKTKVVAGVLKKLKLEVGVDFVLFDGEEYIFKSETDQYFFGSKHFAEKWVKDGKQPQYDGAVLLDMIAGKNAKFPVEGYTSRMAKEIARQIWGVASELKVKSFRWEQGIDVQDDHLALNRAGIPTVDVIDFDYPHWHKLSDTPDKCSADQMADVARVVMTWIQMLK